MVCAAPVAAGRLAVVIKNRRVKLPKQWRHWCRVWWRLRPYRRRDWHLLRGHGCAWRVTESGFQCARIPSGRWKYLWGPDAVQMPMPKTYREFCDTVHEMLRRVHRG